jgi:hypothetical protein
LFFVLARIHLISENRAYGIREELELRRGKLGST